MTPTLLALLVFAADPAPTRAQVEFFEAKIRPVLVEKCQPCHGPEKQKGGLRLDGRAFSRQGGDTGPAVVPGKPDASLLLKAVRYADADMQMPPKGKLPADQIAALEAWVRDGAPDPRDAGAASAGNAKNHWAFEPILAPKLPPVRDAAWGKAPIDVLVLAKLEACGLTPSPAADRRTLLRRLAVDLTGLPPTFEEVRAFEADTAADAYEKQADRLLASPRYGERWARHWLDVARYADTKDGVLMFGDDRARPFAYTYRDYVIRAFNADLPFDRFVHEQLAADRLATPADPAPLAAMGFLTLGRMFDGNVHDVIDDRIDVVTRGLLGITVACARCHDHKYDPVPTRDYYALYGVFAGSESPMVLPRLDPKAAGPKPFADKYAATEKEVLDTLEAQYVKHTETARTRTPDYLLHIVTTPPDPLETAIFFLSLNPEQLRPPIVARWRALLAKRATPTDSVFGPWHDLFALPDAGFPAAAAKVVAAWQARPEGNAMVLKALAAAKLEAKADVAKVYGAVLKAAYTTSKTLVGPQTPAAAALVEMVAGRGGPAYFPKSQTRRYMSRGEGDAFSGKVQQLDTLAVKEPAAPARAMCLVDAADLSDPRVFVRGNPSRPGDAVPRRFLTALGGSDGKPFAEGSGRLDLARAITAPENPLTARVLANRVWMHHIGEPLVDTPSDFGVRTTKPVQADLLDHLAASLVRNGWSLKKLHREIVLSNTYRQASADRPAGRAADPDNRLLWRANPRRLDFEAMRDSMLTVSGRIDHRLYGRPADVGDDANHRRRTVYGTVDRQSLPGVFRAFDFASPDVSAERRSTTTVPQQALFGLNAPFVRVQAKGVAARPEVAGAKDAAERVRAMFRAVLLRDPDADELRAGVAFLKAEPDKDAAKLTPADRWAQVLLMTNEFLFLD